MISIENVNYEIMENHKDAFNNDDFLGLWTDYFKTYDFILGDYAYGKLRLKGFNKCENVNWNNINDFNTIYSYLQNFCAYDCKYFILKRIDY